MPSLACNIRTRTRTPTPDGRTRYWGQGHPHPGRADSLKPRRTQPTPLHSSTTGGPGPYAVLVVCGIRASAGPAIRRCRQPVRNASP